MAQVAHGDPGYVAKVHLNEDDLVVITRHKNGNFYVCDPKVKQWSTAYGTIASAMEGGMYKEIMSRNGIAMDTTATIKAKMCVCKGTKKVQLLNQVVDCLDCK